MKRHRTTSLTLTAALLFAGCALLRKDATEAEKVADVRNIFYALGSTGTEVALLEKPNLRANFELGYTNLNRLVTDGAVTGALLRSVVDALPFDDLKDPSAVAIVRGATTLFDATVGDRLNLMKPVYVNAAATGLRDGIKAGLRL